MVTGMMTSARLLDALDRPSPAGPAISTGFTDVDDLTGGFTVGQVWLVLATPGQGRTTLAVQWAAALAAGQGWRTWLVCPREDAVVCAARLVACTGKVALNHLVRRRLEAAELPQARSARGLLAAAHLQVAPAGEPVSVAGLLDGDQGRAPKAVILDDADLVSGSSPVTASALSEAGWLVIATLPRHLVVEGRHSDADLDPGWARCADVVLEVRSRSLLPGSPEARAGEAELRVLKHRRGPTMTTTVAFQGHYARFIDLRQ